MKSVLPRRMVFVRHAQSEGNAVVRSEKNEQKGKGVSIRTPVFDERSSHDFCLTTKGEHQAILAGRWIQENIGTSFKQFLNSPLIRTRHTAALLNMPNAIWEPVDLMREREWGLADNLSRQELFAKYPEIMMLRKKDPYGVRMPGGQSIADKAIEVRLHLNSLSRHSFDGDVLEVVHGDVIMTVRKVLERMTGEEFVRIMNSNRPYDDIHNCQILEYTRVNPKNPSDVRDSIRWMRSVCPWNLALSSNDWVEIVRPKFTNDELLQQVAQIRRLINVASNLGHLIG